MDKLGGFFSGLFIAAGLIGATYIATKGAVEIKTQDQLTISVTGSVKKRIRSDSIVWMGSVTSRATTVAAAYQKLAKDMPIVTAYLVKKGIPQDQFQVSSVSTMEIHPQDKDGRILTEVIGYSMVQSVTVRSNDVDKVAQVARECTELINQDIMLDSSSPFYFYTKLGDLKISMLEEAAKDAQTRAEKIAHSTGARLGKLRSARMGVIQVNPAGATDTSDGGVNDTSSLEKDVMTVVSANFSLE